MAASRLKQLIAVIGVIVPLVGMIGAIWLLWQRLVDWNDIAILANTDTEDDPHSPLDGFFHAHIGWFISGFVAEPRSTAPGCSEIAWLCS